MGLINSVYREKDRVDRWVKHGTYKLVGEGQGGQ